MITLKVRYSGLQSSQEAIVHNQNGNVWFHDEKCNYQADGMFALAYPVILPLYEKSEY